MKKQKIPTCDKCKKEIKELFEDKDKEGKLLWCCYECCSNVSKRYERVTENTKFVLPVIKRGGVV